MTEHRSKEDNERSIAKVKADLPELSDAEIKAMLEQLASTRESDFLIAKKKLKISNINKKADNVKSNF